MIYPAIGYISDDKKVAVIYSHKDLPKKSKLKPLFEKSGSKYFTRPLKNKNKYLIAILNSAAGSSKKIQLFLDEKLQITGCLFPAP
jgi:hypothetical protein